MRELMLSYYAYQQWANERILETAATVPFEKLTVPIRSGFDPVRSTLTHMMWAQQLWTHRFMGQPRVPEITPSEFPSLAALRAGGLPRALNYVGLLVGATGIISLIPGLTDVMIGIFALSQVVWFVWLGTVFIALGGAFAMRRSGAGGS